MPARAASPVGRVDDDDAHRTQRIVVTGARLQNFASGVKMRYPFWAFTARVAG